MEDEVLIEYLGEIKRCTEWIRCELERLTKMEKISRYSTLGVMSISIILSMLPAFIGTLQGNWYAIPCTLFSMAALMLDVYWDKSDFGGGTSKCFHVQEKLNGTRSSILRYLITHNKPGGEYTKRIGEKISLLKLAAGINESA